MVAYSFYVGEAEHPLGYFSDAPFQVLSPSGTLFAYLPWMFLWKSNVVLQAGMFGFMKLIILVAVLVPSIYIPRFFCKHICPMGAMLEPFVPYKVLKITRAPSASKEDNNRCLDEVCPMDCVVKSDSTFVDDANCIHCGNCVQAAPEQFSQTFKL